MAVSLSAGRGVTINCHNWIDRDLISLISAHGDVCKMGYIIIITGGNIGTNGCWVSYSRLICMATLHWQTGQVTWFAELILQLISLMRNYELWPQISQRWVLVFLLSVSIPCFLCALFPLSCALSYESIPIPCSILASKRLWQLISL